MTDHLERLKRDYRAIKAPPWLATRIHSVVAERQEERRPWLAVAGTAAIAVTIIWAAPIVLQQQAAETVTMHLPSLTMLSRMTPDRPALPAPSLSKIRSVKRPALPPRPNLNPASNSQTFFDLEYDRMKETDHVYI